MRTSISSPIKSLKDFFSPKKTLLEKTNQCLKGFEKLTTTDIFSGKVKPGLTWLNLVKLGLTRFNSVHPGLTVNAQIPLK
jgi:hypothetical protein